MFDNLQPIEVGWYDWDCRLAVVAGRHAFVLSEERGWSEVNAADVGWDGKRFADAQEAMDSYLLTWDGIDPSAIAAHVVRGIAPPKPRRCRRYFLVEAGVSLDGCDQFTGNILVEFDDGSMRRVNGKELSALYRCFPRIKNWRLSAREDYWWL